MPKETKEQLCDKIMNKVCVLQDYLMEKLCDDEYEAVKHMLDGIWNAAHAIKED
jgi:hypothetical protein